MEYHLLKFRRLSPGSLRSGKDWCVNAPQVKVLFVYDESSFRRVLRLSLAALGFNVEEASTGEQALALLGAGRYDVVLLDIDMPGMGGIETCKEIQKLSPRPTVLMLTVRDGEDDIAKAFEAGADDFVTKPFSLFDLAERVRASLRDPPTESARK